MRIATADNTDLNVPDTGGAGRAVVLLHAWGLDSHMWNAQVPMLEENNLRVISIDRRGHGGSEVSASGYDLDTLAGDVTTVIESLDLRNVVLVGHSMGGLEAARVTTGPARSRIGALVLSAAMTPCLTLGADNPVGLPAEMLDANRAAMRADIAGWIEANTVGYWGTADLDRSIDTTWTQQTILRTPLRVLLATNVTITRADVRSDLRTVTQPALVIHGDADRSAPLALTGEPTAALLGNGRLEVVDGAGHGLYTSFAADYNRRLLAFIGDT